MSKYNFTGGCLCNSLRFRVDAEPLWVAHCHCTSCRRNTGAAFATFVGVSDEAFAYETGSPRRYESSTGVWRSFCADCGTPVTYEADRFPGEVHINIGTLDAPQDFVPTGHVWVEEQLPWLHIVDGLPRHPRSGTDSVSS